jgi:hypothetical protein
MKQNEAVEFEYEEGGALVETPELIAALEEAVRNADKHPGRAYTFEELMLRVTGCSGEPS